MPNLLNVPEVLTYTPAKNLFVLAPGQVYLRGGPVAQPTFGLQKKRPQSGQLWPRSEFPRDKFGA